MCIKCNTKLATEEYVQVWQNSVDWLRRSRRLGMVTPSPNNVKHIHIFLSLNMAAKI